MSGEWGVTIAPEQAVIRHLQIHYDKPERYSSFAQGQ